MASITLETLRTRVQYRAAGVAIGPAERHTTTQLDAAINEALASYQTALVDAGHPQRETRTTLTTSASTTASNGWPANEFVALPSDFLALRVAKVLYNSREFTLTAATELESEAENSTVLTGFPRSFRISEGTDGTKILRLFPPADSAYTIVIVYTPMLTELSDETDSFDFFQGTSDYVVSDAAMVLCEADGVQEGAQYQALVARRDQALYRLKSYAYRQNRAAPTRILDVRRRQRRLTGWV